MIMKSLTERFKLDSGSIWPEYRDEVDEEKRKIELHLYTGVRPRK
jgi:hypothetical protein